MFKKPLGFILLSMIIVLALTACGSGSSEQAKDGDDNHQGDEAESAMEINVGTNPTFPPFESKDGDELVGFDIDIIQAIAEEENLEINFDSMTFDGLVPALETNQIDAAIAGMTISKKRMENADFSTAYYQSGLSIVTKPDSGIESFEDLEGNLVGTQKGTTSVNYLTDHGISSSDIKQYDNITTAYDALENGGVDAVLFDNPVNTDYINNHETDTEIVGDLLSGEYYGIAVSQEKSDLVEKLNDGLETLRENGQYEELFNKYFDGDKRGLVDEPLSPEEAAE